MHITPLNYRQNYTKPNNKPKNKTQNEQLSHSSQNQEMSFGKITTAGYIGAFIALALFALVKHCEKEPQYNKNISSSSLEYKKAQAKLKISKRIIKDLTPMLRKK